MGGSIDRWLQQAPDKTPQPAQKPGDISDWLTQPDTSQRLQTATDLSDPQNPDKAARIKFLQEKTGLPADMIARDPDEVARRAAISGFDSAKFAEDFPNTAQWLAEQPEHVSLALDDVHNLGMIERTLHLLKRGWQTGNEQSESGEISYKELENKSLTTADQSRLRQIENDVRSTPSGMGFWDTLVYKGSQMMGQLGHSAKNVGVHGAAGLTAGVAATALTGGTDLLLVGAGAAIGGLFGLAQSVFKSSAGSAYQQLKSIKDENGQPVDENVARLAAMGVGSLSAALMVGGGDIALAPFKDAGRQLFAKAAEDALVRPTMRMALTNIGTSYAKAMAAGTATMGLQELVNITGEEITKIGSKGNFQTVLNSPAAREQAIQRIATALKEGAESMALASLPGALLHGGTTAYAARLADRREAYFKALGDNVERSSTFQKLPSAMQELVRRQTANGPIDNVYIPVEVWNEYWQKKGQDPGAVAEQVVGNRAQWQEATEHGGDVQIPTSDYATKLAPTEHNAAFAKELRTNPLQMSAKEAAEATKEAASTAETPEEAAVREERVRGADKVRNDLYNQLVSQGVDPSHAAIYADEHRSIFYRLSERTGKTPEELSQEYPVAVRSMAEYVPTADESYAQIARGVRYKLMFPSRLRDVAPGHPGYDYATMLGLKDMSDENLDKLDVFMTKNTRTPYGEGPYRATFVLGQTPIGHFDGPSPEEVHKELSAFFAPSEYRQEKSGATPIHEMTKAEATDEMKQIEKKAYAKLSARERDDASSAYEVVDEHMPSMSQRYRDLRASIENKDYPFRPPEFTPREAMGFPYPKGFYSKAERLIEQKVPNKATVGDVRNILQGVKADERKWTGLDEFLDQAEAKGEKISKQDLLDFVRANHLRIEEVTPEAGFDEHAVQDRLEEWVTSAADDIHIAMNKAIEQKSYKASLGPDGKWEIAFYPQFMENVGDPASVEAAALWLSDRLNDNPNVNTLPDVESALKKLSTRAGLADALINIVHENNGQDYYDEIVNNYDEEVGVYGDGSQYEQYTLPGGDNYREILFTLPAMEGKYESTHFPDSGAVFAHARMKDRVTEDGSKVLFLEEVQSDWHQEGREQGYGPGSVAVSDRGDGTYDVVDSDGITLNPNPYHSEAEAERGAAHWAERTGGVPEAPFANTWHEFVLKRMIREAAEKGYDFIGWTTGDQQNARYNLKNVVDELHYYPDAEGGQLLGYRDGLQVFNNPVFPENLPQVIGKEASAALLASPADITEDESLIRRHVLRFDQETAVGGSGMRGFYDDIVNRFLNKFGKKYSAKTGDINVLAGSAHAVYNLKSGLKPDSPWYDLYMKNGYEQAHQEGKNFVVHDVPGERVIGFYKTKEEALQAAEHTAAVHGLRLTPELRDAALRNEFELFQKNPEYWDLHNVRVSEKGGAERERQVRAFISPNTKPGEAAYRVNLMVLNEKTGQWDPMDHIPVESEQKGRDLIKQQFGSDASRVQGLFHSSEGEGPLGRIRIGSEGFNIDLFRNADFSTFVHESGHLYFHIMQDIADSHDAPADIKADMKTLRDFVGAKDGEALTVDQHEMIARAWEKYNMEGVAPVSALQSIFMRFRAWMMSVYSSLRDLHVDLTDEVRQVFDRMLASDDEIKAEQQKQPPLFSKMEGLKIPKAEAESYTEAVQRAHDAASEQMSRKIMQDWQHEQSRVFQVERDKTEKEVGQEANNRRNQKAWALLRDGKLPNGDPLPEGETPFKLNSDDVRAQFGDGAMDQLRGMTSKDPDKSLHPDLAAGVLGFDSGEELMNVLKDNAEDPNNYIQRRTDAIMKGKKAQMQMMTASQVPTEAMKAVHNEKRAELLRKELQILASQDLPAVKGIIRRLSRRIPLVEDVRDQARSIVEDKVVGTVSPFNYLRAEQKAARAAIDAFNKGDIAGAFDHKQRELLNHELFRAATDAQDMANRAANYMRRFDRKQVRQRLGLAKGSYLEQIDALRERFDFQTESGKATDKRQSLRAFLEEQQREGKTTDVPDYLVDEAFRKNYKELKVSQLRGLFETAQQIAHMARTKNKLLALAKERDFNKSVSAMVDRAGEHFDIKKSAPPDYGAGLLKRTKRILSRIDAGLTRMEFLFKYLDGHKANGPWWNAFIKPIQDAENVENIRMRKAQQTLYDIFGNNYSKSERAFMWHKKYEVPELQTSLTKPTLLAMALNMGNEYNKEALLDGHSKFGWTEAGIHAALDHLDQRDWQVVQQIWDHLESYWPEIAKLEKDVTGLEPEKVKSSPVVTKFGTMRGGYYPIMFDKDVSWRQAAIAAEESTKDMFGGEWAYAMTKHGHTKERVGTGGKPLLLTLSPLVNHLSNVIHDLSFRRAIIDVNKLMSAPEIQHTVEGAVGRDMYREMRPWLVSIARERRGEYANAMEQIIARGRAGATIVHIGWRLSTGLVHLPNYLVTVKELGPEYATRGLADTFGNPMNIRRRYKWVQEQSPFMRERFETFDRDVRDQMKRLNLEETGGVTSVVAPYLHPAAMRASFFQVIHHAIMAGSVPTWLGGFRKAMDGAVKGIEAGDKDAAIGYADSLVREVWSAGSIKDLASLQRGNETWRAFTMFYTYMGTVYNQMKKVGQEYKLYHNFPKLVAGAALTWFLPAAASSLIVGKGPDDKSDPVEWAKWLGKTEASWPFETVPILRDMIYPIMRGKGDYYPSAAFDVPKTLVQVFQAMEKKVNEGTDFTKKDWNNIVDSAGYFLELPTKQMWLTLEAMYDFMTGNKRVENVPADVFHSLIAQNPSQEPASQPSATSPLLGELRNNINRRTA